MLFTEVMLRVTTVDGPRLEGGRDFTTVVAQSAPQRVLVGLLALVALPSAFCASIASCPLKGVIIMQGPGRVGDTIGNAGEVYVNDLGGTETR